MSRRARASHRTPQAIDPWVEKLAWLMDRSIRIGPWSIGIDPLLGLIPGFGDMAGGAISAIIILRANAAGVPKAAILHMLANIALDSLAGAIPFVGDLFDFAYKANSKNLEIYRQSLAGARSGARDWGFLILLALALLVVLALPILALVLLLRRLM